MVRAFSAYVDVCYLVRRSVIDEDTLAAINEALGRFYLYRTIFQETGVRKRGPKGLSLPRQHALKHYPEHIPAFGAPNGLCSSITESKHIKAVKKPWRRSSRFKALGQMLQTNQRLNKLAAARRDFKCRGMLTGTCLSAAQRALGLLSLGEGGETDFEMGIEMDGPAAPQGGNGDDGDNDNEDVDVDDSGPVDGPRVLNHTVLARTSGQSSIPISIYFNLNLFLPTVKGRIYPRNIDDLGTKIGCDLSTLTQRFLYDQLNPDSEIPGSDIDLSECPEVRGSISVFHSAVATFYAPSDLSGVGGMYRERIRATPSWKKGDMEVPRYDCVFVEVGPSLSPMQGLLVGRIRLFFSFHHNHINYPCALVQWFQIVGDAPDIDAGMWIVEPEHALNGSRLTSVVHLDSVFRGAHLLPVFDETFVPANLHYSQTLDLFRAFYVNKYIDHHAFETLY